MPGPTRIRCLRHCQSQNVLDGVCGEQTLAPLTKAGWAQARAVAARLALEPIGRVYTSAALRARQTAEVIATTLRVNLAIMPELAEVGIGEQEGATDPVTRRRTAEVLHAWIVDGDLDARVADGETGHQVTQRMVTAFTTIATAHPGRTVAVVGHVASLTTGLATLCSQLGSRTWGRPLPPGHPVTVEHHQHTWTCRDWPRTNGLGQVWLATECGG